MAYMRYKEIPHQVRYSTWNEIGDEMLEQTGLRAFPVIRLPDGRWMGDTTPMMLWFEKEYPQHAVLPEDPVASFFVRLMEDYADEWFWRPAILSRWQNKQDRAYYQYLFPREIRGSRGLAAKILGWLTPLHMQRHFLSGDGVTKKNRDHIWSIYTGALVRLEEIFQIQPYLMGEKPCLADFGFFASMFWHFSSDPTPSRIMHEQAPAVNEWVARMWNARGSKLSKGKFNLAPNKAPAHWDGLLSDVCTSYLPYLAANADAYKDGKKRFSHTVDRNVYPNMRVSLYRVWCLEQLQGFLSGLTESQQADVRQLLSSETAWKILTSPLELASEYDPEGLAPFANPRKISSARKLSFSLNGSSYHTRRRAWDDRGP